MKISCELLGSSFELPAAPRRIVSLVSAATETVAALGARERLIGVSPYCSRYVAGLQAPVVGDYVKADVAALAALAPDLLLFTSGVQLTLARRCAAAGLPAYAVPVPASRFGVLENIVTVGALIGRITEARALAGEIAAGFERLRANRGVPRPRVYAELWFGRFPRTTGGRTFVHDLIELAGGENVFGSSPAGYLPLDLDAAAAARPDVVLLFSEPEYPVDAGRLLAERGWTPPGFHPVVSTVDRGRNLIHDGPSFAETAGWLAECFRAARVT
jgi:ABC-type Fe3+-hydroxamate transport system substrate-binding protein